MVQPLVFEKQRVHAPWSNFAGRMGSRFLIELRDNQRIMGLKCTECNKVYVPPKSVCPVCFGSSEEWVAVSNQGELITYTVVNYQFSEYYQTKQPPYGLGIIKLDGADTGICHYLDETDPSNLKIGSRWEAVFKKERTAHILDIDYFTAVP